MIVPEHLTHEEVEEIKRNQLTRPHKYPTKIAKGVIRNITFLRNSSHPRSKTKYDLYIMHPYDDPDNRMYLVTWMHNNKGVTCECDGGCLCPHVLAVAEFREKEEAAYE